jgi:hypothetical protein
MTLQDSLSILSKEIEYIFDNESSFFLSVGLLANKYELEDITFGPEHVRYYYWNTDIGQHYADTMGIKAYLTWRNK